ncbi:hypothetical protein P7C73_g2611, partial [Tremellales sp. Uapishka_1]
MRKSPYLASLVFLLASTILTLLNVHTTDMIYMRTYRSDVSAYHSGPGGQWLGLRQLPYEVGMLQARRKVLRAVVDGRLRRAALTGPMLGLAHLSALHLSPSRRVDFPHALADSSPLFRRPTNRSSESTTTTVETRLWDHVDTLPFADPVDRAHPARLSHGRQVPSETKSPQLTMSSPDKSYWFGVASAVVSGLTALLLTFTGLAARAGQSWAAGSSAKKARRHRRTKSGRVVGVPQGVQIPPEQAVTNLEVEVAQRPTETTGLLAGQEGAAESYV